jgi:hypothetical protein
MYAQVAWAEVGKRVEGKQKKGNSDVKNKSTSFHLEVQK